MSVVAKRSLLHRLPSVPQHTGISSRLEIFRLSDDKDENNFEHDVISGLSASRKYLLPKYFYDDAGSQLFEKITETKEYYLTRTETEILKIHGHEIINSVPDSQILLELGSGSSAKTRLLINGLIEKHKSINYFPIDLSGILITSAEELVVQFPAISISGIIADYFTGIQWAYEISKKPKLIIFLGSSIGNFTSDEMNSFLEHIHSYMWPDDRILIGFDLIKDEAILHSAYNDKTGYTARFNLNLLNRMNCELGANFKKSHWQHSAFFDRRLNRIEMHLVSKCSQSVYFKKPDCRFSFRENETIHTENSYKFSTEYINQIAQMNDFELLKSWQDSKKYFALCLFKAV